MIHTKNYLNGYLNNMKTLTVKKIFRGCIDIRSYDVEDAIKNNTTLQVNVVGEKGVSTYPPEELKEPVFISKDMPSKFGRDYKLHSYTWKPEYEF